MCVFPMNQTDDLPHDGLEAVSKDLLPRCQLIPQIGFLHFDSD